MHAKLVVVEPDTQPGEYPITLPMTIGRGHEATVKLVHALVSRQHCELFSDHGKLMVRDLGSLNGTFVGGRRVETAPLSSGELLTVGSVTMRIVFGEDAVLAAPAQKKKTNAGAIDTIKMEDTAQAAHRPVDEEMAEPLGFSDDEQGRYFNPSDN